MVYHQEAAVYLDRCKAILQNEDSSAEEKLQVLSNLYVIVCADTLQLPAVFERIDPKKFKQEFRTQHVTPLVEWLCSVFIESNAVVIATSRDVRESLIRLLVCCDDCLSVLLLLCSFERRNRTSPGTCYVGSKALLLQAFFEQQNILAQLIVRFATSPAADVAFEGDIISRIVSVPDRAATILGSESRDSFYRDEVFVTSIIKQIAVALEQLTIFAKQQQKDMNLRFAGRLLGKLAAHGHHDMIWNVIMSQSLTCSRLLESDPIYVRILSTLISNSPVGGGLENILVALLARAPHYDHVKRILGPLVARRADVEQLLTKQFVFVRCFAKVQFCRNLIGYLASSHAWAHLFRKLLVKLVDTWGSRVGIRHQSYEQQLYLSRLLMCSAAHIGPHNAPSSDTADSYEFNVMFRSKLIEGVTNHLESPIAKIARLGMVVGEVLTNVLYPPEGQSDDANRLQFDIDVDDEVTELKGLAFPQIYQSWTTAPLAGAEGEVRRQDNIMFIEEKIATNEIRSNVDLKSTKNSGPIRHELAKKIPLTVISNSASTVTSGIAASDEGLSKSSSPVPPSTGGVNTSYELSLETSITSLKKGEELDSDDELPPLSSQLTEPQKQYDLELPTTVRQCLEFLNAREQDYPNDYYDRFVLYLRYLPVLIRRSTVDLSDLSVELAGRLLCLECPCRMADFLPVRTDSMVAITVACPVPVARYLTSQFFEPTYSISHRLDILRVLSTSAEVLSSPPDAAITPSKPIKTLALMSEITNLCHPPATPQWRLIVDKRIKEKTVYFGKNRSSNELQRAAHNRFGQVAGEFFYPLLRRYDGTSPQMDLINRDFMVLERLIYSLAIIYHSAADTPGHPRMTKIFLEFLMAIRNHEQPVVRRAVIFSLAYVFLDVQPVLLKTEFDPELRDFSEWLVNRCAVDSDAEISRLTENVLARLYDAVTVPE